jgi:molecular chaperone IbpA
MPAAVWAKLEVKAAETRNIEAAKPDPTIKPRTNSHWRLFRYLLTLQMQKISCVPPRPGGSACAGSTALRAILLLEDVVMRTYDFAPLFRSTIGFDRLFDKLEEASARADWPPYNIERTDENQYRISMAVAGFDRSDIEVVQQGSALLVTGEKKPAEQSQRDMLHQGLPFRNFRQTFNLADHVKVSAATIENGVLSIELVREVPEALKPRRIEIGAPSRTISAQDNQAKLSDQNAERQLRAA